MQAQDLQAVLWAVGQRVPGSRVDDVRGALDRAEIVRSWPMRGTLHVLAPEDLKWMLAITSERLIRGMAGRHRDLGINDTDVDAAAGSALQLVTAGAASRAELFQAFERAGQSTAGQRGIHLLGILCQRGLLVQGPLAGEPAAGCGLRRLDHRVADPGPPGRHRRVAAALPVQPRPRHST